MRDDGNNMFRFGIFAYALFLPFSISGAQAAMGFLIIAWVYCAIRNRRLGYRPILLDAVILFFLLWVVVAAFFSVHPQITLPKLRRYWIFLGYFALARACMNRTTALQALKVLTLSAGVVAVYGICQHAFGNAVPRFFAPQVDLWQKTGGYYHAVGLFDHHLTYGNSLLLVLLAGVGVVAVEGWTKRSWPYTAALALGTAALVFSYARSAWLGFAAGLFAFAFQMGKRVLVPMVVIFSLVLGMAVTFSPSVKFRLGRAVSAGHNLERIATWTTTCHMIRDHPIFGIGIGSYRRLAPEYRFGYNIHWTAKSHAHNSYLQVAVESGPIALIAFLTWLSLLLVQAARSAARTSDGGKKKLLYALFAGHIGFCVSSFFQHNLGDAEVAMTWFLLMAATVTLLKDESTSAPESQPDPR